MRPVRRTTSSLVFATGLAFAFSPSAVANPDGEAQRPLANRLRPANLDRMIFSECESEAPALTAAAIHQNELWRKSRHHCPASFFSVSAYRFTTSSTLVPKSFNITTAAFLPGPPVTEPPGCVVARV